MSDAFLSRERERIFASPDNKLYLHVGYFMIWYNHVEWKLTVLMAIVMNERDFVAFDQLVRGMDGKTKVERLRNLCRIKKWSVEENFDKQLTFFHDKICNQRNKFAHRALVLDEKIDRFHFATIEKMPWKVLGVPHAKEPPPDHIDGIKLFELGYWMNHWGDDLNEVIDRALNTKPLGTEKPRAKLPGA